MSKTILIIEDDAFLQGLEANKLKKEGYTILNASNGKEAYAIFDNQVKIDLILLDLLLPEIDGFTVLETIRKNKNLSNVPVIVFSNLSEEKDIQRVKELGVNQFMIKSNFTLDELAQKVKEIIGS